MGVNWDQIGIALTIDPSPWKNGQVTYRQVRQEVCLCTIISLVKPPRAKQSSTIVQYSTTTMRSYHLYMVKWSFFVLSNEKKNPRKQIEFPCLRFLFQIHTRGCGYGWVRGCGWWYFRCMEYCSCSWWFLNSA